MSEDYHFIVELTFDDEELRNSAFCAVAGVSVLRLRTVLVVASAREVKFPFDSSSNSLTSLLRPPVLGMGAALLMVLVSTRCPRARFRVQRRKAKITHDFPFFNLGVAEHVGQPCFYIEHANGTPASDYPDTAKALEYSLREIGINLRTNGYLEDLFVLPELRGRGIGKALLKRVAAIALEKGCQRLQWEVLDWNTPAIEFYRAMGAEFLDDWRNVRLGGEALKRLAGGVENGAAVQPEEKSQAGAAR